LEKQLKDSP